MARGGAQVVHQSRMDDCTVSTLLLLLLLTAANQSCEKLRFT